MLTTDSIIITSAAIVILIAMIFRLAYIECLVDPNRPGRKNHKDIICPDVQHVIISSEDQKRLVDMAILRKLDEIWNT